MSGEEVAKAFAQHYYTTFDSNVAGLASMFVSGGTPRRYPGIVSWAERYMEGCFLA